jgi:hypothetical protein
MATLPAVHVESSRLDLALSQECTVTSPKRLAPFADVLPLLVIGVGTVNPAKPGERIPAAA